MKRFFDKIVKTDSCWNWTAALRGKSGYGCLKYKNKVIDAHRFSWILHNGDIPNNLLVCHSCDNRKCVNPNHLFLGTASDNMQDCLKKGRLKIPRTKLGRIPPNAVLSKTEVVSIKNKLQTNTVSLKKLAEELSIPYQTLRDIKGNRSYKTY